MLTQAQLKQRKEAGRALASKVGKDYYKFIGRKGGNTTQYNQLMQLANSFEYSNRDEYIASVGLRRYEQMRDDMRELFRAQAEKYKNDSKGTKMLLALWSPEYQSKPKRSRAR